MYIYIYIYIYTYKYIYTFTYACTYTYTYTYIHIHSNRKQEQESQECKRRHVEFLQEHEWDRQEEREQALPEHLRWKLRLWNGDVETPYWQNILTPTGTLYLPSTALHKVS